MTDTPPAVELCILAVNHWSTCMTKAEWSGWVQAFGSIAALFGIWITIRKQRQQALDAERRAKAAATLAALTNAKVGIASVSAEVELMHQGLSKLNMPVLRMHRSRLAEALAITQGVQLEHLPMRHQGAVIGARATAVGLGETIALVLEAQTDRARLENMTSLTSVVEHQLAKVHEYERHISAPLA